MAVYINVISTTSLLLGFVAGSFISLAMGFYLYRVNQTKQKKHQSNHWNNIFVELGVPVLLMTKDMVYEANESALSFLRADNKEQIIGHSPLNFLPENYHHFFLKRIKMMVKNRSANIAANYQFIRFDGTKVTALVHAEPIEFKDPALMQVIIIESDHILSMNQRLQKFERRLRDLILHLNEGVGVFKPIPDENDGALVFSNRKLLEYLTGDQKSEIYQRFSKLFHSLLEEDFEDIFQPSNQQFITKEIYDSSHDKYYQTMFYMNQEKQLVVHMTDITSEKQLIEKYKWEKYQLESILDATDTVVWSYNKTNNLLNFHQSSMSHFSNIINQIQDADPEILMAYVHPEDRKLLYKYLYTYEHKIDDYFSFEIRFKDASENFHWMLIRAQVLTDGEVGDRLISGTMQDISKDKANEEEIAFLSMHDYLTKVYNLRAYEKMIDDFDQKMHYPISLALIDVNGLKVFNDAFSHSVGDQLLVETADVLTSFKKDNDVVARIGGDEFVFIMTNTSKDAAQDRFEKINHALKEVEVSGIPISIAYGIAEKKDETLTMSQLKNIADSKMYQQKFKGTNTRIQTLEKIRNHFFKEFTFEKQVVEMVHKLSMELGHYMSLDYETLTRLDIASAYYNIGIFAIEGEVFNDERAFSEVDMLEYQKHVETGYRIILATHRDEQIARAVLHHHEKFNGEGYPGHMKEKEIPLCSRMIAIIATYSRKILLDQPEESVRNYIDSERNESFDPDIIDEFYKYLDEKNA
jgi:diguanylate cyclase (GGDEF)-like protein